MLCVVMPCILDALAREIALHLRGAALAEREVVLRGASLVRVAGDRDGHARIRDQDRDLRVERGARVVAQVVPVVVEVDLLREDGSRLACRTPVGRRGGFTRCPFGRGDGVGALAGAQRREGVGIRLRAGRHRRRRGNHFATAAFEGRDGKDRERENGGTTDHAGLRRDWEGGPAVTREVIRRGDAATRREHERVRHE